MNSDEFRQKHIPRILNAYPEKKRIFFVHIPKSAGSDLASHLTSRFPTLNTRVLQRDWASNEDFLLTLKEFALEVERSDTIFVTGHNKLALYESWNVLQLRDRIFTVLREPISQVISQVNYVLTRIFSTVPHPAPDTLGWRRLFAVDDLRIENSREEVLHLAERILHNSDVTGKNIACAYLGAGSYEGSVERAATFDVEIVDLSTYEQWCREAWGITHSARVNESKRYLGREDFSPTEMDYIRSITENDRRLHGDLVRVTKSKGSSSVRGLELARSAREVWLASRAAAAKAETQAPTPPGPAAAELVAA